MRPLRLLAAGLLCALLAAACGHVGPLEPPKDGGDMSSGDSGH